MKPEELRKLRLTVDISQQELADKLDVTKQYYSMLETGKKKITNNFQEKLFALSEFKALEKKEQVLTPCQKCLGEEMKYLEGLVIFAVDNHPALLALALQAIKKHPQELKRFLIDLE